MNDRLVNYLKRITNLSREEVEIVTDSMEFRNLSKGELLVKEGQYNDESFFVLEGLVKQFKSVEGNEVTTNFFTEEQWILTLENFDERKPSEYSLICVEDTIVVTGNEQKAQELFKQSPRFETISRQIMETVFLEQQKLMASYITEKPEQRYLKLLASRPDIFQRVPQYDIATYIGVKPESLSRIRKKLHNKGN